MTNPTQSKTPLSDELENLLGGDAHVFEVFEFARQLETALAVAVDALTEVQGKRFPEVSRISERALTLINKLKEDMK